MSEQKWQWFGHVAHFICGHWCRFHLATLLSQDIIGLLKEQDEVLKDLRGAERELVQRYNQSQAAQGVARYERLAGDTMTEIRMLNQMIELLCLPIAVNDPHRTINQNRVCIPA